MSQHIQLAVWEDGCPCRLTSLVLDKPPVDIKASKSISPYTTQEHQQTTCYLGSFWGLLCPSKIPFMTSSNPFTTFNTCRSRMVMSIHGRGQLFSLDHKLSLKVLHCCLNRRRSGLAGRWIHPYRWEAQEQITIFPFVDSSISAMFAPIYRRGKIWVCDHLQ